MYLQKNTFKKNTPSKGLHVKKNAVFHPIMQLKFIKKQQKKKPNV